MSARGACIRLVVPPFGAGLRCCLCGLALDGGRREVSDGAALPEATSDV